LERCVEPELLDQLPVTDLGAVGSRRDLMRINVIMGHDRMMARNLMAHTANRPRVLLDIGAGDGTFMLRVARRLSRHWLDCRLILLDRHDVVRAETRAAFGDLGWAVETVSADVFDFFGGGNGLKADIVTANLFLHHFDDAPLSRLMSMIAQRSPLFLACEPRRDALARIGSRLLGAIGCNGITLHDAAASVRAGFRGGELSALWPRSSGWIVRERAAGCFSHSFAAWRPA